MTSDFLEKTLEDIIFENYKVIKNVGLPVMYSNIQRQFSLPSGKIIDLITWEITDNILFLNIIELKRKTGSYSALSQLLNYVNEVVCHTVGRFKRIDIKCIVICKEIDKDFNNILLINPQNLFIYTYKYDINGVCFKLFDESMDLIMRLNEYGASPMIENDFLSQKLRTLQNLQ